MSPRPLVKEGSTGPDVIDAILRLNLAGADPQLAPSEPFGPGDADATKIFQSAHGLFPDGQIGDDTWGLLDQLDGGRLVAAADGDAIRGTREQARALLDVGDYQGAQALLEPVYANPGVPPEIRASVAANLGWAEHGMGNLERARALYLEQLATLQLFNGLPLQTRDTLQRLREVNLGEPPGTLVSDQNKANLPPDG